MNEQPVRSVAAFCDQFVKKEGSPILLTQTRKAKTANGLILALLYLSASPYAYAQSYQIFPRYVDDDQNEININDGTYAKTINIGSIGDDRNGISYDEIFVSNYTTSNVPSTLGYYYNSGQPLIQLRFGRTYKQFSLSGGVWTTVDKDGSTLTASNGNKTFTYVSGAGETIVYNDLGITSYGPGPQYGLVMCGYFSTNVDCSLYPISVTRPDGHVTTLTWQSPIACYPATSTCMPAVRLTKIQNNAGYEANISYIYSTPNTSIPQGDSFQYWLQKSQIEFKNNNVSAASWPTATYSFPSLDVTNATDIGGRTWRITTSTVNITPPPFPIQGKRVTGLKRPSSSSDTTTIGYDTTGKVSTITRDGVTTTYTRSTSGGIQTTTATNPLGGTRIVATKLSIGRPTSFKDELNRQTTYTYDAVGNLLSETLPEGNQQVNTYDTRGNLTTTTLIPKSGSGLANIVTNSTFLSSCTSVATCNLPTATIDGKGNQTDYTYNSTTGLITSATLPAATLGGVRPQTNFSYTAVGGVSMLTGISTCQTTSGCAGGADEVKTTIVYNSNLLPTSVSKGSGNGSLTATTTTTYDAVGNAAIVDGPLSGTADSVVTHYDAARQIVGVVGPDPDGGGSRIPTATKLTYNADGQVTLTELGTVANQSDPAWAAFSTSQQSATTYDANARPVKTQQTSGGTTYALSQISYDALGRVDCTTERMDPSVWASQTVVCTPQMSGSFGADRIVKTNYNAASEVTSVQSAYGTSDQATDVTSTYNSNGTLATVKDSENNLTTYEYDGFDRLRKTRYPSTTQGAGTSSTTDYEQLTYDANANVTQRRLRDGQTINYTLDNLNRVTFKDLPNGVSGEADITYSWDNFSRPVTLTAVVGNISFTYDALGRTVGENGVYGAKTMQYDLAGRMTRFTWPDGVYIVYDYDLIDNVVAIRENGAASGIGVLAAYSYDNIGRRTSVARGNGTSSSYSYDNISRLSSLSQDLSGSSSDLTIGSMAYNPASQLTSQVRSNDAYAWNGHYNVNRNYTINGLNQMTAAGATSLTYDGRGNLNTSGSTSYLYAAENWMASGGAAAMVHDPLSRLKQLDQGSIHSRFDYLETQLVTELDSSNTLIVRRYVPGPDRNEPILWYEGSGITDRRWLHEDERGSIIAVSDASGASTAINRYDEYGIPAWTNLGRFQYTGQAWIPEIGMYYYKARMYSPTLGRFMQTDPIGYNDGINWYNYVDSDPINNTDPEGLAAICDDYGCDYVITAPRQKPQPNGPGSSTTSAFAGFNNANQIPFKLPISKAKPSRIKPQKEDLYDITKRAVCVAFFNAPLGPQDLVEIAGAAALIGSQNSILKYDATGKRGTMRNSSGKLNPSGAYTSPLSVFARRLLGRNVGRAVARGSSYAVPASAVALKAYTMIQGTDDASRQCGKK